MSNPVQSTRKFKPEPVEISTTTSSKNGQQFNKQTAESSTKSSKQTHKTTENERDSVKRPRKFAVQPIEVIHSSSKEHDAQKGTHEPLPTAHQQDHNVSKKNSAEAPQGTRRKFAPVLVETASSTSKERSKETKARRFSPQLIETTEHKNKSERSEDVSSVANPRRKFPVQLLESASRSRKAGNASPTVVHFDQAETIPKVASTSSHVRINTPPRRSSGDSLENSAYDRTTISDKLAEARRLGLPLPKRQDSHANTRSHSFRVPELDPIDSSESECSDQSDIRSIGSEQSMKGSQTYEDPTRRRESVNNGYFLRVAARQQEKRLQDAALAAFPNDDRHRPVDHFVDKDDDDSNMSDAWSVAESDTMSSSRYVKIGWEMREMQKHAESKATAKENKHEKKEALRSIEKKSSAVSPWGNVAAALSSTGANGGSRKAPPVVDSMATMRKSARPPMLGSDIKFPRCPSPEPARFDVTQSCETQKQAMCYLSAQISQTQVLARDTDKNGMWTIKSPVKAEKPKQTLWGQASRSPSAEGGLWAGSCVGGSGLTPPRGPTGLMTPMVQDEEMTGILVPTSNSHQLPPSPPPSATGSERATNSLEEKLRLEQDIDAEFADAFVTQVYNYLSLGYPSMARKFDHELAKIARVDLSELRQDDVIAGARGYIRFGEENGLDVDNAGEEVKEHHCARWRALRAYVREWARQQPSWRVDQSGWGTTARRGSWAW